jgi:hypothetical protein
LILADISLGDILWTTIVIFFMVVYFMILFQIIFDIFRDHTMSGVAKAIWCIVLLFFPLITMIIYLIVRGPKMQERAMKDQAEAKQRMDSYIRDTAGKSAADEIASAKQLLDSGAISQAEFEQLKQKALAG